MRMETKRKSHLVLAAVMLLLVAGAAWAGISGGRLNSDATNVDLGVNTTYPDGSAANEITLGTAAVNLTGNLTLGSKATVTDYAATPIDRAVKSNAGGAIYVADGETLNITPNTGNRVSGAAGSSLRLFGTGTTNLHGSSNYYPDTFIQSGRLNIESKEALGGSNLTIGGGTTIGLVDDKGALDLSGAAIELRRYDDGNTEGTDSFVTFDAGSRDTDSILLPGLKEVANAFMGSKSVGLLKHGKGRLIFGGVAEHTGGTTVAEGTLELRAAPQATQTIEVYGSATLKSTLPQLLNISFKPQPGSTLSLPATKAEAKTQASDTGTAALALSAIESAQLNNDQFTIHADLSGVTFPTESAESYYVKLVSCSSPHNLSASNISLEGISPATGNYSMKPYVDGNNIYAVLTWEAAVTESVSLTVARAADSATVTARLSDGADGKPITFTLKENASETSTSQTVTSANGSAQTQFGGLTYGTYTLTVSASGYNGASRTITIDGTSSTESSINVTVYDVYDEATGKKLLAVRLDNSPNAFPGNASFKYRFIEAGGTAAGGETNPVTNLTTFTARNVTFSNNRTQARFDIDTSNLVADDGKTYALAAGKTYQIWVEDANNADRSNGTSVVLVDNNGQYVSPGSLMIATYAQAKSADWIAAWAIATKSGVAQPNVEITFTLLDIFGNAVNVDGVPNMPTQSTNANGRADVSFGPLPHDEYIIRTTVNNANITGYSRDVRLGSSSSSGGGCNAGFGLLALAVAFATVKRKKS